LKGKKNLPVQQAAKVQLVLNLKALQHDRRSACSAAPTREPNSSPVRALMDADGVDPDELRASLRTVAQRFRARGDQIVE